MHERTRCHRSKTRSRISAPTWSISPTSTSEWWAPTTAAPPKRAWPPTTRSARSVDSRRHRRSARFQLHRSRYSGVHHRKLRRLHGVRHRVPGHRHPRQGRRARDARGTAGRDHRRSRCASRCRQAVGDHQQVLHRLEKKGRAAAASSASSSIRPSARAAPNAWTPAAITTR